MTTEEGVKRSTHFHLEISHVSYQIEWNAEYLENKHSVLTYTPNSWVVTKVKYSFIEYGHAAYQIGGTYACSNMVASIVPEDTPSTSGVGSKGQNIFFSDINHVEDQINGNGVYSTLKVQMSKIHPH